MENSYVAIGLGLITLLVIALIWYFDDTLLESNIEKSIAGLFAAGSIAAIAWGAMEHGKQHPAAPPPPPPAILPPPPPMEEASPSV